MKTGMILISNPNIVFRALPVIQNEISNTVYIQYFPNSKWNSNLTSKTVNAPGNISNLPLYSTTIVRFYSFVLSHKNLDVRVILSGLRNNHVSKHLTKNTIDVVYHDQLFLKEEVLKYVSSFVQNKTSNCQVIALPNHPEISNKEIENKETEDVSAHSQLGLYDNVVLGGTFDRLHYGHKIMLSEAVLHCRRKITVGVTDGNMLKGKKLWELIEPCNIRIQKVKDFLEEIEPSLEYDVVPINDIYGPTKDDPSFQMIVVSSETVSGGSKVNQIRVANGLNPLQIHKVELLADVNKEDEEEEDKISSSNLRLRCLGTLLRTPKPNPNIPEKPYVIGLTGGIASGKTRITQYLEELGASVVNCDLIGHQVYEKGTPGYQKVVKHFGQGILDEAGAIDRKRLGQIVFSDKNQLSVLSQMIWPLILEKALAIVRQLYAQGRSVIILEAAVLIHAGWQSHCHEVWVSIIPPSEAIKRVMERNGLSEDEAKARLEAQPSNTEYVQLANVVFSSLWRTEFTRKQVLKAWTYLKERMDV